MPRAKLRTPELRDRMVREARDLLEAEGPMAFTTRRVAAASDTSVPAVYELFGDRGGLLREVFFDGFRRLAACLAPVGETADPVADLRHTFRAFRTFASQHPHLTELMYSRPFTDFDPTPEDRAATGAVRELIVQTVRRAVEAGHLRGDPVDISHVLLAMAQGLALQERGGWLGTSSTSMDRRWELALTTAVRGLAPSASPRQGRSVRRSR